MKPLDVKYCFSPSLLDSFQSLLDFEENWERYWGSSDEPSKSLEEYQEECNQSLLDAINNVPFTSEASSMGKAWNDLIDTLIHKKKCGKTQITRKCDETGKVIAAHCELDGFSFDFDINDAKDAAKYFADCLSQIHVISYIETKYGIVNLHGYLDEHRHDVVYDIKTTKSYEFGNYLEKWQKHVYPYCLLESGVCTDIKEFEYTVFQMQGGRSRQPIITAKMYTEVYTYLHDATRRMLKEHCELFIEYIERNRDKITNDNLFKDYNLRKYKNKV